MNELTPIELIAHAAYTLGEMRNEVVFLGGAVVGLLITERGGVSLRATKDVDVVMEIGARMDWYRIDERLRKLGFVNDMNGPVCRYLHGMLVVDVMPTDPGVLGFANRWHPLAVRTAEPVTLPDGLDIKLITAPCFLATKMEAFDDAGREGHGDIFASRDFGDVIRVIDGRPSIAEEVLAAPDELRHYLRERFVLVLAESYLEEAIAEHVDPDRESVVIERICAFAEMPA